jgi:hypothetical protein
VKSKGILPHGADVWLHDPCEEMALLSDQYDFTISLLHLDNASPRWERDEEEEQDVLDKFTPQTGMRLFEQG